MFSRLTNFQKGNRQLSRQNYSAAMKHFRHHAERVPEDAAIAYAKLGYCYQNTNTIDHPKVTETGALLVSAVDKANAEKYYLKALELDRDCLLGRVCK